ncbi:hypothetical protein MNBD_NITROSPINAE02-1454 [hydrothermal vent metagenome]|uniref:DUF3568 family protein n=1 Tax=hydrothermal vent metagenome TaxID=652676 RepID=A0A3B1CW00_9ZZZZ
MKRIIAISLLMPLLWGCQLLLIGGAGTAVGAYMWASSNLTRNYMQPMDKTWDASVAAVTSMGLEIISKRRDTHYGVIKARLSNDETLKIALEKWTNRETRVTIRAGKTGSKETSTRVHEEIARAFRHGYRF